MKTPYGGNIAAARFWNSGALRSAGSLAALRFEVRRSFGVVGNVLVKCFFFGNISAILGKVSAILVMGRLAIILRRPAVDLKGGLGYLGNVLGAILGGKLGPSGRLRRGVRTVLGRLERSFGK